MIASAIPWALHVLLVGRVADRMAAPFLVAGGQFLVCGLLALAWSEAYEPVSIAGLHAAIVPIVYTGVFSVGIAFTAQVVAQRCAHANDAAIVLSAENCSLHFWVSFDGCPAQPCRTGRLFTYFLSVW